jgi:hypothetical protein
VSGVSRGIDRIEAIFDDPHLVANAGLVISASLMVRLGLEALVDQSVRLVGRVGGARPGRKVLTLVAAILAGGSHIDHADVLRSGATRAVLPFRVMAPSTLGTFLRAFTFGHVRQLDAVIAETLRRAWQLGAGTGVIDWTDAAIADPADDLALIYRDLGPRVFDLTLAHYQGESDDSDRERCQFCAGCALIEDIAYGLRTGERVYAEVGLAHPDWTFA